MDVYKRGASRMSKETVEGITKIAVSGFKSLANECAIDIRPLTILAGANSSGKSSIMQPLLMLKQTLEATYDPGPLLIEGPNVQFTSAEQFLSKLTGEERMDRFQVRVESRGFNSSFSTTTTFRKVPNGIEHVQMTTTTKLGVDQLLQDITLYPEMPPEKIKLLADQNPMLKGFDAVRRSRCFLRLESQDGNAFFDVTPLYPLSPKFFNSIYIPGLRGNPERTFTN